MILTLFNFITASQSEAKLENSLKRLSKPGPCPTNDILIEFEIRPKFEVLKFKMYSAAHNEILQTSRQCICCDVCKISMWSVEHILN